ncbi:MAG TPA: hypothetical protein VJK09_00195 [Candidatus Paceibacterota bacterium]
MNAQTGTLSSQLALIATFAAYFAKEFGCEPSELEIEITYVKY